MKRSVVDIHPEAILEGRDARDWYFSKSAQAEEAFRIELERAIRLIREAPETWPRLWSAANAHTGRRASASSGWELSEQERPKEGCRFRARCAVYRAMGEPSICREKDKEPELREIGPNHHVRCHFPEGGSIEA